MLAKGGRLTSRQMLQRFGVMLLVTGLSLALATSLLQADSHQLKNRSLKLSNPAAGASSNYLFNFAPTGLDTLQTISFQFCANSPLPGTPCTAPTGFDASGAQLLTQTGDTGFSISGAGSANQMVLQRSPIASGGQPDSYEFGNVINPGNNGSYYVRIELFQDSNLAGQSTNYGGIAYAINNSVSLKATVPPYLLMCAGVTIQGYDCNNVTGDYVDFGELSSHHAAQGSAQLLAASNAKNGYVISVGGTTLTSGNNELTAMGSNDVSRPGVSQFGLNLRANSTPQGGNDPSGPGFGLPTGPYNQINFYRFVPGEAIASTTKPDEARKYTMAYIVNVPNGQAPGIYVATMLFVALGSY